MKPTVSAGCVVTRPGPSGFEILLVHPRKATFKRPVFGIPKGWVEEGEELEAAALRETLEETGLRVRVRAALGSIKQKSGKTVHGFWALVEPESESAIDEQGRCRAADNENDVCRFYTLEKAAELMIPEQCAFLERVRQHLDEA